MSLERGITSIQKRLKPYIESLSKKATDERKKFETFWNGEDFIAKIANKVQARIENYHNLDEARHNFIEAINIYGETFLNDQRPPASNDDLFNNYKTIKNQSPENTFDELDIESRYHHTYMGDPERNNFQFRKKTTEYIQNKTEEVALSYLFMIARQSGAKPFNKELELRQIREVYHNLSSDHGGMDTGEGKTRVDIPIYTIAKSLFYPKLGLSPSIVVTSADEKTTQEVHAEILKYQGEIKYALSKINDEKIRSKLIKRIKITSNFKGQSEDDNLNRFESILTEQADPLKWMQTQDAGIGTMPLSDIVFSTTNQLQHAVDSLGPSAFRSTDVVTFKKKGHIVRAGLKTIEPPDLLRNINKAFLENMPTIVADEVHMADQTPYQSEIGAIKRDALRLNLQQSEVNGSLCQYLSLKLFESELLGHPEKIKSYIVYDSGVARLTKKGTQEVARLRKQWLKDIKTSKKTNKKSFTIEKIAGIFESDIEPYFKFLTDQPIDQLVDFFENSIIEKGNSDFDQTRESALLLGVSRSNLFTYSVDQELVNLIDGYLGSIQPIGGEGSFYVTPDLLIDHLRGTLLRSHRFSSDVSFFLNALEGKPEINGKRDIATKINFYTWLALVNQNNFIGLSNDLFYTDPETGDRVLSTLGKVLEKYTEGKVVDLSAKKTGKERIPIPAPQILNRHVNLIDKVGKDLSKATKPEMIVVWNENSAQELLENFKKQGKRVVMINSQTSEENADLYQHQFSNYGVDILITTGRKSFSADFKDESGRFTDFRVSVINPETIFQVSQAFGRLRLPKKMEDFSLYFEKNNLLILASSVLKQEQDIPFFSSILGKADPVFTELQTLLNKKAKLSVDEQKRLKKITIEVLRLKQNHISYDWEKLVDNEIFFIQTIAPMIKEAKKKVFFEDFNQPNSHVRKMIRGHVDKVLKKYQLSGAYGSKLQAEAEKLALSQFILIDESIINTYYNDVSFTSYNPAILKDKNIPKEFLINQINNRIRENYQSEWRFDLFDTEGYFFQERLGKELAVNLDFYGQMLSQASSYLKDQQIPAYKVDQFIILDSPLYEPANNQALSLTSNEVLVSACHNQTVGITTNNSQTDRFIKSGPSTWNRANTNKFERDLAALNKLSPDYFKEKKYIDVYFDIGQATTKFMRLIIKN